jgi:hypothetical protein
MRARFGVELCGANDWGVTGRIVAKSKASTNDHATRSRSHELATDGTSKGPILPERAASKVSTVLAEFRDRGSWDYTSVEAAARVSLLNGDDGELRIEVAPSSSEFKFFAEPHVRLWLPTKRDS